MRQRGLFGDEEVGLAVARSGSFVDNMRLPIHRWFRYSAGFSAAWVIEAIRAERKNRPLRVLDPFAGSGTVVLAAESCEADGLGIEPHPFVARVAQTKLSWREDIAAFRKLGKAILTEARKKTGTADGYPPLIGKCFPAEALERLDAIRQAVQDHAEDSRVFDLCWLALASILRICSPVGTAQWQYILPNKSKARAREPFGAYEERLELMAADMRSRQFQDDGPQGRVLPSDARTMEESQAPRAAARRPLVGGGLTWPIRNARRQGTSSAN